MFTLALHGRMKKSLLILVCLALPCRCDQPLLSIDHSNAEYYYYYVHTPRLHLEVSPFSVLL